MKPYITPFLVIATLITLIVIMFLALGKTQQMTVVVEGNVKQVPLEMDLNKYQDGECGMIIDDLTYASQVVSPEGKTWFFHDHGGMAAWLKTKTFQDDAVIWVRDRLSETWIDGRQAWYSRTEETPMLYGFGAYSKHAEERVDFMTMQNLVLRGETMADPAVRRYLLDSNGNR